MVLPNEVWAAVFSWLDLGRDLCAVAASCTRFRGVVSSPSLWRHLSRRQWGYMNDHSKLPPLRLHHLLLLVSRCCLHSPPVGDHRSAELCESRADYVAALERRVRCCLPAAPDVGDGDGDDGGNGHNATPTSPEAREVEIEDASGAVLGARSLEGLLRYFFSEPSIRTPAHSPPSPTPRPRKADLSSLAAH